MVGRRADEGQAEGHVDGGSKAIVLIGISAWSCVMHKAASYFCARSGVEHRVGREGAGRVDPVATRVGHRRRDRVDFLATDRTVFACVRIEPEIASRGFAIPKRARRSAATILAVLTIGARVSGRGVWPEAT